MGRVHVGCTLRRAHSPAQPCRWAGARGWLPPSRALLAPGWAPSLSSLQSSAPCPLPPSSGSLILSSWKPDSLFPSSLPSLSLSLPAAAPPPPLGGLWPQGCPPAPLPRLCPHPAHPGGPLQLFQLSNYRKVEGKSLGPRSGSAASDPWQAGARGCSLDWVSSCQTRRGNAIAWHPGASNVPDVPRF